MSNNLQRMLQLVNEFFDTKNDSDQLQVTEEDRKRLEAIHPATMTEYVDGDGPVLWILLIPTTQEIMNRFIKAEISETQLLHSTPIGGTYDALYLCSASVLPEYRRKGLAKRMAMEAINEIRATQPLAFLFTWSFSDEGKALAAAIAKDCGLPLYERVGKHKS
jgi:ribosomal protein S18 acetylase RimI-like enzyme